MKKQHSKIFILFARKTAGFQVRLEANNLSWGSRKQTPVKRHHMKKALISFDESKFDTYLEWCKQEEQCRD